MPDQTRDVKIRLSTEKAPGIAQPFQELRKESQATEQQISKSMGSIVGDIRKADRGVTSLSKGMHGLTFSLMAMSGTLQQSGGHMSKFAEHAMKAATAVAVFHSLAQTIRGLALVIGTASKAMYGYAAATLAAAAANKSFATSAAAGGGAAGAARGFGLGALGAGALGLAKGVGGAILGSTAGVLGGAAAIGGGAAYGIHGLATGNWDLGLGGLHASNKTVSRMEQYQQRLFQEDARREEMLKVQEPFLEHQRQMAASQATIGDIVPGMRYRRGLVNQYGAASAAGAAGLVGALRAATSTAAGTPLGALHLAQTQEQLTQLGQHGAERQGDAALQVRQAQTEFQRAQREQVEAQQKLHEIEQKGQPLVAERLHAQEQLRQATQRELEARMKVVEATREQGKVNKEVATAQKEAIAAVIKGQQTIIAQEQERIRGVKSQFGLASREEQQAVVDIARRVSRGPGRGSPAQWRMVGGQWQQTPGTGTNVSPEDLAMLGRFAPEMVQRFGEQAADKSPLLKQFMEITGQEKRLQEAQAAAKVAIDFQNKIALEINMNEEAVEKQLSERLIPQITSLVHGAMAKLKQEMETAMIRADQQRFAADRAKAP